MTMTVTVVVTVTTEATHVVDVGPSFSSAIIKEAEMGRYAYALFGLLMISLAGFADYRGWSLVRPTELHNLPKSIRDNPGSYARSIAAHPITSEASNLP